MLHVDLLLKSINALIVYNLAWPNLCPCAVRALGYKAEHRCLPAAASGLEKTAHELFQLSVRGCHVIHSNLSILACISLLPHLIVYEHVASVLNCSVCRQ